MEAGLQAEKQFIKCAFPPNEYCRNDCSYTEGLRQGMQGGGYT